MPPPKKVSPSTNVTSVTPPDRPDVGDIALDRFTNARTGTRDTYQVGGSRYYNYNYSYSYPWFWGGFPFIGFGCFGNKFVGCVGHGCH